VLGRQTAGRVGRVQIVVLDMDEHGLHGDVNDAQHEEHEGPEAELVQLEYITSASVFEVHGREFQQIFGFQVECEVLLLDEVFFFILGYDL